MANSYRYFELVCQFLQLNLPEAHTIAVAATAIGRDQPLGFGMALLPHRRPPPANGVDSKCSRVVVGADASDIGMDVVDSIRHRTAQFRIDEVVNVDEFGLALGAPLATVVLEISHQFLALGVDRDDRLISAEEVHRLLVDVTKLCVAVDMPTDFPRL